MKEIKISTIFIKLDAFLKYVGIASSGSDAKLIINTGLVKVNGESETRRGRKLKNLDVVEFQDESFKIIQ